MKITCKCGITYNNETVDVCPLCKHKKKVAIRTRTSKKRTKPTIERNKLIIDKYKSGMNASEVARNMNVSRQAVELVLKREGIYKPRPYTKRRWS